MPASNIDSYLQDARNNFDAVRLAPICADANRPLGQCQNVHVSTNCYYGYQDVKNTERPGTNHVDTDCEMVDLGAVPNNRMLSKPMSKKRCADEQDYPQTKRLRDDKVQREKNIEPETNEKLDMNTEDLTESLYWHIHGGNMFHLIQCL